jgi:hypothetical protein
MNFSNIKRNSFICGLPVSFLVLFVCFTLSGCNHLLDESPENTVIVDEIDYTISDNMRLPILGVYGNMYGIGWEKFPTISVRGDDVNAGGLGDQAEFTDFDNFKYYRTFWMAQFLWEDFYQRVMRSISAVDEINEYRKAGANATLADRFIAEAKTIRGFYLYYLTLLWGDILIPTTADPTDLFQCPLSTKEEALQHISDLMDEAIPHLPDMHPKSRTDIPGGVTKHTALAIKARVNLVLGNYQKVADATSEIIKSGHFKLEPDFYELWYVRKGKLNDESLFEWQYSDFGTPSGTSQNYGGNGFFVPQSWSPKVSSVGNGWGFYEPSMKYIKFMLDRGETVRLETTVLFTDRGIAEIQKDPKYVNLPNWISNTTRSGDVINNFARAMFSAGKFVMPSEQQTPGRNSSGSNKNFHCIRYAEILLMHAEALTRGATGSSISALEAVNLVRTRAQLPPLASVTLDQIIDERFAELATEWGHRFFDMVRLERYDELSYDGRTFNKDLVYLYYPQSQVDMLPILRGLR